MPTYGHKTLRLFKYGQPKKKKSVLLLLNSEDFSATKLPTEL
jgi:hypothetical protein